MRPCSAWTKRPRSRRWIARIRYCRCRRDEPSAMALNTSVTAPCRCTPPSTPRPARCSARRPQRHTAAEFVAFLTDIVIQQPRGKEIHVIADNLSAHKSQAGQGLPGSASQSSLALHSDLLLLAQSSRAVVRQDRARCDRARRFHFRLRPEEKAHALHPSLQQIAPYREVEICRSIAPSSVHNQLVQATSLSANRSAPG